VPRLSPEDTWCPSRYLRCAPVEVAREAGAKAQTAMAYLALDDVAPRRLGSTLNGKWRLDAILGVGGMATVYAATHRNGHRVAVKMLHPLLSAQDAPRERFLREGYISNKVDHPDAVCVLDEDVDEDGNVFLVMELLEGNPVSSRLRAAGGRLPVSEALWIANRLLSVLEAAHAKGVVHRDIKPENLFLTSDGGFKVLDFGIARFGVKRSVNTLQGIVMGTPGFAAPEQVRGEWDLVDARADLFSVGATLFALIVGKLVHERSTPYAHLQRTALEPAPPLREVDPSVPAPVAHLIDRALCFRPQDRFQTAAEMRRAVVSTISLVAGQPLSERRPLHQMASTPSAPSEAAPTVLSAGLTRPSSAERLPFRRVHLLRAACVLIGFLAVGYWRSGIHSLARRYLGVDSTPTVVTTDMATGVRKSEMSLQAVAASPPTEPVEPEKPSVNSVPDALPSSPYAASSATPASPPARVHGGTKPLSMPSTSAEIPVNARPALSAEERIQLPPAVSRPVRPQPQPAPTGGLNFVESRH